MLERPAVASQPGLHLLITNQFGVLVPTPGQYHHEHPGFKFLTSVDVGNYRPGTEVDLRNITGPKVEHGDDLWMSGLHTLEKPADR